MVLSGLTFGIYPLSVAGTPFGLAAGPKDDYEKIRYALRDLRGESKSCLQETISFIQRRGNQNVIKCGSLS